MSEEKTKGQTLAEELFYKKKSAFELWSEDERKAAMSYCEGYSAFLDDAKTEREAVEAAIAMLSKAGFRAYKLGDALQAGDKVYYNNRGKSLYAMVVGTEPIECGVRISAAHIDSPRLDLKQHPLYESEGFGYFKTHYYGGIRKYQWATIPLALHGAVTKMDGETVNVRIGDLPGDPVFCLTDLLPHLAKDQNSRPLGSAFTGEGMNVLISASPYFEEDGKLTPASDKVKLAVMAYLNEKYGMTESDFMSAELCIVPAGNAVDVGFDRWLIGSYGHDDRVCAYPALTAMIENKDCPHTLMCVLADKEETGSEGVTGMQCSLIVDLIDELARNLNGNPNVIRANSMCLSADVNAGFDPNYPEVYEKRNTAIVSAGVAMSKYTGSGGKGGTNDASAEFVAKIRAMFKEHNVLWQTAELGKVDQGGGGTVAKYIAKANIDTVDLGVPVLSMHAPFEIVSKADVYSAHKAFSAFCK
ncbi:MAG: aminopeptidase [Ruminococcaceae bacterium]|nr:aminopeptidase [Oscillospiraceae bacterium]